MQAEDGFVHNQGEEEYVFNFFFFGNAAEFIVEGDSNFGF